MTTSPSIIKTNAKNDRVKRDYLIYLGHARKRSPATIDQVRQAIDRLEVYTGFKDFGSFCKDQALGFKAALLASKGARSGKRLSTSTAHHILQAIKEFLAWLQGQPGYRRRINVTDIAYLNLTTKEEREAHVARPKSYPTVAQYKAALFALPSLTETERRDRAVMALILLAGMRDAAAVSLKLKHISIERRHVFQDPREVHTKFSKAIETFFFPVGSDVEDVLKDWVLYLTETRLFGPSDPLLPKSSVGLVAGKGFEVKGLSREHWANATPIRDIFRRAFAAAGLPYFKPHSVRDTLTQLAYQRQLTPEQLKAWSQNLGHESVLTTLGSYGRVTSERQGEVIAALRQPSEPPANEDMAAKIAEIHAIVSRQKP